ncbi:MAG TPA: ABC transporter substrate-binding protein [Burkholderiaceae bacterium]|nr:ABC transporter substrate-binding protein [Burkholderiaceae bacterium]
MNPSNVRRALLKAAVAAPVATPLAVRAQAGTVKIGSVLSVTGPAAFLGEDMKAGMELAIEQINAAGGIGGRKIEWFFYDAESQTQKGLNALRRLMTQDNVDIVVGGGNMSGMAMAMLQVTEKAQLPFISTEGAMTIVHPVAERPFTFKSTVDDDQVIARLADYFSKKGIKKVGLLADSSGFGQSAVEQAKKVAPARGLEMIYETFNPADTDLTPQLTKLKGAGVQAIVCWTVASPGVVFMKQARAMGIDAQLVQSYGFVDKRYMDLAGDAAKDVLLVSVKFPVGDALPATAPSRANIAALTAAFEKRFGRRPNQFAAQTYDAIMLAKMAIEKGGTDKAKVRDALRGIKGYQGVGGTFNFAADRHSGLSKDDLVLLRYEGGRFRLADYK